MLLAGSLNCADTVYIHVLGGIETLLILPSATANGLPSDSIIARSVISEKSKMACKTTSVHPCQISGW